MSGASLSYPESMMRTIVRMHAWCTANGRDCLECNLPRRNAIHRTDQPNLLENA